MMVWMAADGILRGPGPAGKVTAMTNQQLPHGSRDPLLVCALMPWFDRTIIQALSGGADEAIDALLSSDMVLPMRGNPTTYALREETRAMILAEVRASSASHESTYHRAIFAYCAAQSAKTDSAERRAALIYTCRSQLEALAGLLGLRDDWHALRGLLAELRASIPGPSGLYDWLDLYEGIADSRMANHARAAATLAALHAKPGLESDLRLQVLNALGNDAWSCSRYGEAIEWYQQTLAQAQASGDHFYQAVALANIGMIYSEIADYQQAFSYAERSYAQFHSLGRQRHAARARYDLGRYALLLGRWQAAFEHFTAAVTLLEQLGDADLSYLYWSFGLLHHMLGNEAQSEDAYLQAERAIGPERADHMLLALDISLWLGFLYQTQARYGEALARYDDALALAERSGNRHQLVYAHYRRSMVLERQGQPDAALAGYRVAIDAIEQLREATGPEMITIGLLGTVAQVYEATVRLCLQLDRPDEAFGYVERARSRAFLDQLAARPASAPAIMARVEQPVATLAEVQRQLAGDTLLIEYFTIGVLPRGESLVNKLPPENTRLREHLTLPPQTLIFAVTHDRLVVARAPIDPNLLRPSAGDPAPTERLRSASMIGRLHAALIEPVAELITGRQLLYLIPHGPLHYVPFMALCSPGGRSLLAGDGPAIALAPSATILLRSCLARPRSRPGMRIALGYNDEQGGQLRYAEPEARHIARLAGGEAWAGQQPKREQLIETGPRVQWLHIAGHAIYDPHDPLGSALQLGAGDTLSAREIIARLGLSADLVTLSACTSGTTQVVPGDELLGLPRAFLYAGAPAVVCALWETHDLVALLVMDGFYRGMLAGKAPAAALRDAQVAVRGMTGRALQATLDRWRAEDPVLAAALTGTPVPSELLDQAIYADPAHWATFMLIGRGD